MTLIYSSSYFLFVLDTKTVTALNFMDALDNGLIVCRLAKTIQEQAQQAVEEGRAKGVSIFLVTTLSSVLKILYVWFSIICVLCCSQCQN